MGDKRSMLGILGGMGPQATNLLYQMVIDRTPAKCDQDHIPTLIYSDAQMPDRTSAILSGDDAAVRARLVADAKLLASCGCTCIAIPCNTAHYFADDVQER
ncbi:MAG: aspartate/glutamate racemase family protein, partial [Coriobacteriales bacterium]|nr:aspartate/glutamate racemase family protein [Coriobacteriales bacterium]